MTFRVVRISWRRNGLRRPSVWMTSASRPSREDNSSRIRAWSKTLHLASEVKVASTSTSLSGLKSPRKTDPKSASSLIFHLRQKLSITSSGISSCGLVIIKSILYSALAERKETDGLLRNRARDQKRGPGG